MSKIATKHIDDDAVTYAKMQNVVADERLLGRVSGANGVVEELTKAQVLTMINVEDGAQVNVDTDLSIGTVTPTNVDVNSSTGDNVTLPEANTDDAGLLGADKWDEIVANTSAKHPAVTIGTANGLSLSTQALSLAAASTSTTGALTDTDWDTFNGKSNLETEAFSAGSVLSGSDKVSLLQDGVGYYNPITKDSSVYLSDNTTDLETWRNGVTETEMGYLDGVTSNIQAQFSSIGSYIKFTRTSTQSISSSSTTSVEWQSSSSVGGASFASINASDNIEFDEDGIYMCILNIDMEEDTTGRRYAYVGEMRQRQNAGNAAATIFCCTDVVAATDGDPLYTATYQNSGSSLNLSNNTICKVIKLS